MNDDPDTMLKQTIIICALFWASVLALVFLPACTPTVEHQVTVPQLASAEDAMRHMMTQTCPTLAMPPIPQDVVLDIKGDKITANDGGELLVRYYSRARQLLKPAAP